MEDTLRGINKTNNKNMKESLNPCFNGRYSQSPLNDYGQENNHHCLNPCFNGRYSQRVEDPKNY